MNRFIRLRLLAMILCLPFLLIFISGCGSSSQKKDEPPVYSPLQVLVPEATGKKLLLIAYDTGCIQYQPGLLYCPVRFF